MNTPESTTAVKSEFMLLFRNTQLENRLEREQMSEAMERLNEWLGRWSSRGNIKAGQPLGNDARVIRKSGTRLIADGPYAEAKEAVGGYVVVFAADINEAAAIAGDWPLLDYGATVEVRPVRDQCATMERIGIQLIRLD
jgi:hypothetical protein